MASIVEDIKFAEESIGGEFPSVASMLRYVAAINADATRKEFVEACVAEDYGVDLDTVKALADLLGPNEDFDGLVSQLEDMG